MNSPCQHPKYTPELDALTTKIDSIYKAIAGDEELGSVGLNQRVTTVEKAVIELQKIAEANSNFKSVFIKVFFALNTIAVFIISLLTFLAK